MIGSPLAIVLRTLVASVAMVAVAAAFIGYWRRPLPGWQRVLLGLAALSLVAGTPLALGAGLAGLIGVGLSQKLGREPGIHIEREVQRT
jgi:TRAP-type uncharacterized transport system fused permease subunit